MKESYELMNILSIEEAKKFAEGKNTIVVTGVTGQDGSFMVDYLLKNTQLEIFGGARRLSVSNHKNIDHLEKEPRFHLINFDLTDTHSISQLIALLQPKYFINFAAQSFVKSSWDFPAQTWETNTTSVLHILEAIRLHCPTCRFYNAGSSEEFGDTIYTPQDENHPMRPRSPYGASKAAARQLVKVYRESYGLYAVQGWLFNHEGTRRGEEFVTRKITKAVGKIAGQINFFNKAPEGISPRELIITPMELGNVNAIRDWSDAEDCVDAVWRMLNQEVYNEKLNAEHFDEWYELYNDVYNKKQMTEWESKRIKEYVVSSDIGHSIREFVEEAFRVVGFEGQWVGEGVDEWFEINHPQPPILGATINPAYYRPAEVNNLLGSSKAIRHDLGWSPKTDFKGLVKKMVDEDMK